MSELPSIRQWSLAPILGVILLAGCSSPKAEHVRQFRQAEEIFATSDGPEDYLRAAAIYQKILDSGIENGAVLYNQGNAFLRAGERGRAIAAYRRAFRYRPRDPYLAANLATALGEDSDVEPERGAFELVLFWQNQLGVHEKFTAMLVAGTVVFLLGTASLFAPRRTLRRATFAMLTVTALLAISAGYDWYRFEGITRGVVVAPQVVARTGNAESYEPAFTEPLPEGLEFVVRERRGDWLLIQLPSGPTGWLEEHLVVIY